MSCTCDLAADVFGTKRNLRVQFPSRPTLPDVMRAAEALFTVLMRAEASHAARAARDITSPSDLSNDTITNTPDAREPSTPLAERMLFTVDSVVVLDEGTRTWSQVLGSVHIRPGDQLYFFQPRQRAYTPMTRKVYHKDRDGDAFAVAGPMVVTHLAAAPRVTGSGGYNASHTETIASQPVVVVDALLEEDMEPDAPGALPAPERLVVWGHRMATLLTDTTAPPPQPSQAPLSRAPLRLLEGDHRLPSGAVAASTASSSRAATAPVESRDATWPEPRRRHHAHTSKEEGKEEGLLPAPMVLRHTHSPPQKARALLWCGSGGNARHTNAIHSAVAAKLIASPSPPVVTGGPGSGSVNSAKGVKEKKIATVSASDSGAVAEGTSTSAKSSSHGASQMVDTPVESTPVPSEHGRTLSSLPAPIPEVGFYRHRYSAEADCGKPSAAVAAATASATASVQRLPARVSFNGKVRAVFDALPTEPSRADVVLLRDLFHFAKTHGRLSDEQLLAEERTAAQQPMQVQRGRSAASLQMRHIRDSSPSSFFHFSDGSHTRPASRASRGRKAAASPSLSPSPSPSVPLEATRTHLLHSRSPFFTDRLREEHQLSLEAVLRAADVKRLGYVNYLGWAGYCLENPTVLELFYRYLIHGRPAQLSPSSPAPSSSFPAGVGGPYHHHHHLNGLNDAGPHVGANRGKDRSTPWEASHLMPARCGPPRCESCEAIATRLAWPFTHRRPPSGTKASYDHGEQEGQRYRNPSTLHPYGSYDDNQSADPTVNIGNGSSRKGIDSTDSMVTAAYPHDIALRQTAREWSSPYPTAMPYDDFARHVRVMGIQGALKQLHR